MATARKLPSGNWRVRQFIGFDDSGKQIVKSFTAKTKKEAEFLAAEYMIDMRKDVKDYTIKEALTKYIESRNNILSPSTISGYNKIMRNNMQNLMSVKLPKLTNEMIQAEINRESVNLSPKSLKNAFSLLSSALAVYHEDFKMKVIFPPQQKQFIELPNVEDVIVALKGSNVELPAMLSLWLGLRMSEVRGIRYKDIKDGYLTIQNTIVFADGKDYIKEQTKTKESKRRLKLPKPLVDLIDNQGADGEYVISDSGQAIYKRFKRQMAKHDINIRFHDLRHLNASLMLKLGISDLYAMQRGGWSNASTLKRVYQHTFDEDRQAADALIDDFISAHYLLDTKLDTD